MNKKYLKKFGFASLGGVAFAATTYCIYSTTEVNDLTKEVDDLNNKIVARTIATNYQLGVKDGITKNLQEIILKPEKEQAKLDEGLINKIKVNKTAAENQLKVYEGIIKNLQEIIHKFELKGEVYKPLYENIKKEFEDANKTLDELGEEITKARADLVLKDTILKATQEANEEFNKVNVDLRQKVKELEETLKEKLEELEVYIKNNPLLKKECFVSKNPSNDKLGLQCPTGIYLRNKDGDIEGPFGAQLYTPEQNGENAEAAFGRLQKKSEK